MIFVVEADAAVICVVFCKVDKSDLQPLAHFKIISRAERITTLCRFFLAGRVLHPGVGDQRQRG